MVVRGRRRLWFKEDARADELDIRIRLHNVPRGPYLIPFPSRHASKATELRRASECWIKAVKHEVDVKLSTWEDSRHELVIRLGTHPLHREGGLIFNEEWRLLR